MIEFRSLNSLSIYLDRLIQGRLWLKVIIGLVLGAALGIILIPSSGFISKENGHWIADWLDLPGQIFMRLIQMVMIPLIFTSIISGIVSNTSENLKNFGVKLLLYFVFTTSVAIILGILTTLIFKPGTTSIN